jgi:hypothetical protein
LGDKGNSYLWRCSKNEQKPKPKQSEPKKRQKSGEQPEKEEQLQQ